MDPVGKPPAVADAFLAHCGVQGSRGRARCTEIRGDLDSTVFSRWQRAQQPPAPVERLWGKNRVDDGSAGGSRSGKEVDPGWWSPICILRKHRLILSRTFLIRLHPWSIWLLSLRRGGNSYATRDDYTFGAFGSNWWQLLVLTEITGSPPPFVGAQ